MKIYFLPMWLTKGCALLILVMLLIGPSRLVYADDLAPELDLSDSGVEVVSSPTIEHGAVNTLEVALETVSEAHLESSLKDVPPTSEEETNIESHSTINTESLQIASSDLNTSSTPTLQSLVESVETSATSTDNVDIETVNTTEEISISGDGNSFDTNGVGGSTVTKFVSVVSTSDSSEEGPEGADLSTSTSVVAGPTIVSGRAVALANIMNIVNTNLVNSDGDIIFSNFTETPVGGIDLRSLLPIEKASSGCSLVDCSNNSEIDINFGNGAYIQNVIDVEAGSGGNMIENGGEASITTGDAFAALNLVNIANMNFVDSNYLLVSLNAFLGINGDIVFPNLDKFFQTQTSSPAQLTITNEAIISNDILMYANSGDNYTDAASSTISGGDAHASSNVFNQINATLGAHDTVSILLRVHGAWEGQLVNAPTGLTITRSEDGGYFFSNSSSPLIFSEPENESSTLMRGILDINGTSTAIIDNTINVSAETGDNTILGRDSAHIISGNAYAGANVINIANANVIGRNWVLAIVNIFGDFTGDIAFGQPDLWVGERVITTPPFQNGLEMTYRFTVINNGDAKSTNVTLIDSIDRTHLDIVNSSLPYVTDLDGKLTWDLGDIPPGAAVEVTLTVRIKNTTPGTEIANDIEVRGTEREGFMQNNKDRTLVTTHNTPTLGTSYNNDQVVIVLAANAGQESTAKPQSGETRSATSTQTRILLPLEIIRPTANSRVDDIGVKVPQTIIVRNPNNELVPSVIFRDILRDSEGATLRTETWDLETILPNEEITIGYDIEFVESATSGTYFLSSVVSRPNTADSIFDENGMILLSKIEKQIELTPTVSGEVLSDSRDGIVDAMLETLIARTSPEKAYAQGDETSLMINNGNRKGPLLAYFYMPMIITVMFVAMQRLKKPRLGA